MDKRIVFYNERVAPTGYELILLQKIEAEKQALHLPKWWRSGDTLRFGNLVQFDVEKTKIVSKTVPHPQVDHGISQIHRRHQSEKT